VLQQGLYFGSELKCLRVAGVPADIDADALRLFFQFTYIPEPLSCFRAVRKLPAGSWLTYDADGTVRQGRYWQFPRPLAETPADFSADQTCDRLREKFDESVRIRLIADVPLGAFLSGGIDSSSVVASMARASSEPVRTFSIGFEESAFNELEYASMVAREYHTEHHEIVVRPDAVDLVSRLVRHFDEPFGDSSAIPTFIVSEFAARYVKVALSVILKATSHPGSCARRCSSRNGCCQLIAPFLPAQWRTSYSLAMPICSRRHCTSKPRRTSPETCSPR
jgi:asparagine synthase (glutamine-hydrolysing)